MSAPVRRLAPILFALACRSPLPVPGMGGPDASPDGAAVAPSIPPTIGPMTLPDDRDGSRLKVRWYRPADGADAPFGVRDEYLGTNCTWVPYEGGTFRCLPPHVAADEYADPQCTRPLLVRTADPCVPPRDYVTVVPAQLTCPASTVVRRRGTPVPLTEVFRWGLKGCTPRSLRANEEAYELGELVPASGFAGATRRIEPLAEGWSRVYLEGDDGSRWVRSLRRGEVDCRITTAADGVLRCVPVTDAESSVRQADCSSPAAFGARSSCVPAEVLVSDLREVNCSLRVSVFHATGRLDRGFIPQRDGTCEPATYPDWDTFAVGEELPPGDFTEAVRGILEAPGRLKRYATQTPAGVHGLASYWDSQLAAPCAVTPTGAGRRCVPDAIFPPSAYFADAFCTHQLVVDDPCRNPRFAALSGQVRCAAEYRIFRLGPAVPAPALHRLEGDRCVPVQLARDVKVRELGEELSPREFVSVSLSP